MDKNDKNDQNDQNDQNDKSNISNKEVVHQLITFAMKHRKIMQQYLNETGVYHAQHRLLMEIYRNPNASQVDIARLMEVSAATVAVSLKKLKKGGYINKEVDEGDNRLHQITITEKGNKVIEQSKQIFEATDRKVFEGLTEEEKATLSVLLKKLDANLTKMDEKFKKERK